MNHGRRIDKEEPSRPYSAAEVMRSMHAFSLKKPIFLLCGPFFFAAFGLGCGGNETESAAPEAPKADLPSGSTAIVAVVNPVVNTGHFSVLPKTLGSEKNKITLDAQPGGEDKTGSDGLALVPVEVGALDLGVGGASLSLTVQAKGDVYDAPIALNASSAAFFVNTPIRYPVGDAAGPALFAAGSSMADIEAEAAKDFNIIVLQKGTYTGNLNIAGKGVIIYGEGFKDRNVMLDGSITATGEGIRLRGLNITGDLSAGGNDFGISFSKVLGNVSITGDMGAFLRNIFCGTVSMPSNPITLLDNYGIEPIKTPPSGACGE